MYIIQVQHPDKYKFSSKHNNGNDTLFNILNNYVSINNNNRY